jgi:hypothetical protein
MVEVEQIYPSMLDPAVMVVHYRSKDGFPRSKKYRTDCEATALARFRKEEHNNVSTAHR